MALQNKKIVLAITGGIAAYKCPNLVRLLVKAGAEVKVIMTPSSLQFVTAETLSVLSKNEVVTEFFDNNLNWNSHVAIAEWADAVLIAPTTANTLSKLVSGICDNIVCAVYLSAKSKVFIAPAMDLDMYQHPSTISNLKKLEEQGHLIIPAEAGELASGLIGEGRMAEPEHIMSFLENFFNETLPLSGKSILINAGPTYESIDPIRFIGNRSSGKTGIAIADECSKLGAKVSLVLGPSSYLPSQKNVQVIHVESADEMYDACLKAYNTSDIAILTAAVADYTPTLKSEKKIKKTEEQLNIELTKTKDILAKLGQLKKEQILVGFALETNEAIAYASAKINNKNLDFIVINTHSKENPAFETDFNTISILDKHNKLVNFELKTKTQIARDIVDYLINYMKHKT